MSDKSGQSFGNAAETRGMGTAFLVALTLHIVAIGALVLWRTSDTLRAPGEQLVTIDLAPAMQNVEAVAPADVMKLSESREQELTDAKKVDAEAIDVTELTVMEQDYANAELVESLPVQELPIPTSESVIAISPPTAVTAQTLEESKRQSKPLRLPPHKTVEHKPPSPQSERRRARLSNPHQGQAATSRENLQGAAAAADPDVLNRYAASLAATLRDRLRYPEIARSQGISGVAALRFTIHRSGQVIEAALLRSTGSSTLDEAALAVARPGSKLPSAPDSLPQQQFTFSVPLRFNLR